jgi:hypothetical protein
VPELPLDRGEHRIEVGEFADVRANGETSGSQRALSRLQRPLIQAADGDARAFSVEFPLARAGRKLPRYGPNETMGTGDFLELPDPARPVFIRVSRNCTYSLYGDIGGVRANFLNRTKGSVELAPGRSWTARDFWSITPLEASAYVRLEPAR